MNDNKDVPVFKVTVSTSDLDLAALFLAIIIVVFCQMFGAGWMVWLWLGPFAMVPMTFKVKRERIN